MVKRWCGASRADGVEVGRPCGRSERNPRSGMSAPGPTPATARTLAATATGSTRMHPRLGVVEMLRVLSGCVRL